MINYLNKNFENLGIEQPVQEVVLDLPIAYQKKYTLAEVKLDNEGFILIKENRRGALESFVKQAEFISRRYNGKYVLVFNTIKEDEKKLLIKARIPFVDYRGNLFIPKLGLILNKEVEKIKNKQFTASEQLIFTYILVSGLDYGASLEVEKIVEKTRLSIATVYRVLKKFTRYGWLHTKHGTYTIDKEVTTIFIVAKEYLFNPIKKVIYIDELNFEKIQKSKKNWGYAGTYALSRISHLLENNVAIAMSASTVKKMMREDDLEIHDSKLFLNNKMIELELWHYAPVVKNEMVDILSLYMTLKDTEDPRIEKELQAIINPFKK